MKRFIIFVMLLLAVFANAKEQANFSDIDLSDERVVTECYAAVELKNIVKNSRTQIF